MNDLFDQPIDFIPSGEYIATPLVSYATSHTFANPHFILNSPVQVEKDLSYGEYLELEELCRQDDSFIKVNRNTIRDYSLNLLTASRSIKENEYDVVLCPLRGARLAGIEARIICDDENRFISFDGTDLSQGRRDEEIKNLLSELILSSTMKIRKIGILDHAKGGHGCAAMSRILSEINKETAESWEIGFHLLHPLDKKPHKSNEAYARSTSSLHFSIDYYPVQDLLVEDEERLLGYRVLRENDTSMSHRLESYGQILFIDNEQATLLKTAPLDQALFGLVANEVGNEMNHNSDFTLTNPDYWQHFSPDRH